MKNIEKYDYYSVLIDKVINDFCMSFFPNGPPANLYQISTDFNKHEYGLYIKKCHVTDVGYFSPQLKPYYNKKPTNAIIEKIKENSEKLSSCDLKKENIRIHVEANSSMGKTSWAINFNDIESGMVSESEDEIIPILNDKIEHYKKHYLVKEGQFSCSYCNKSVNSSDKITKDIISRQYPNFRKSFDYCSNICASHDQMAHEG